MFAHNGALIFDSDALSQAPTEAARQQKWGPCDAQCACLLPSLHWHRITLLGDRGKCVNDLSKVALDSTAAWIEPAISNRKSNAVTTAPSSNMLLLLALLFYQSINQYTFL